MGGDSGRQVGPIKEYKMGQEDEWSKKTNGIQRPSLGLKLLQIDC